MFQISDENRMLREALDGLLTEVGGAAQRKDFGYQTPYHSPELWSALLDMGLPQALVPEENGGLGGTGHDIRIVFEALGRAGSVEPLLPMLLAARLVAAAGADLQPLLSGKARYAVALSEPDTPHEPFATTTTFDGKVLQGRKSAVFGGHIADRFLVLARSSEGLVICEAAREDIQATSYAMIDGGGASDLTFKDTPARLLQAQADTAISDALQAGLVALCAEAVGAMESGLDLLLTHLRERHQFGKPLGAFQALRHAAVDLASSLEQCRSITLRAAEDLGTPGGPRSTAMAKLMIGRHGRHYSDALIQMHGGMGLTWEHPVSHLAKRLVMIDHALGSSEYHVAALMRGLR